MAPPHTTIRWLAPAAFVFDVGAQIYGMTSTPNMKDINDANMSFFSPMPAFIAVFFSVQQVLQLMWLYKLWTAGAGGRERDRRDAEMMAGYAPYYIVGNLCIGAWMFAWNSSALVLADVFVAINTFTQLYYVVAVLPSPMDTASRASVLTHAVSKTFAGIGVLDLLHNTSIAFFKDEPAGLPVKVATGVGFGAAALASDWIFGACLVYDLAALAAGQEGAWRNLLGGYALLTAVLLLKNVLRPPYVRSEQDYQPTAQDDAVDGA